MRTLLGLGIGGVLGGCSIVYNPGNLSEPPAIDAPVELAIDAPSDAIDMPPASFSIASLDSTTLVEGAGDGGSAPTTLVVRGAKIDPAATVTIAAYDGTTDVSAIVLDATKLAISPAGDMLAIPVTVMVDPAHDRTTPNTRLQIAITQPSPSGTVTAFLPDEVALELRYLDELTDASPEYAGNALASGLHEYSRVAITHGLVAKDTDAPLQIRARADISITGAISVNASGKSPGPGGFGGGDGGQPVLLGVSVGAAGGGTGGGVMSGGGGGFGEAASGSNGGPAVGVATLADLLPPNRGNGGAGGNGTTLAAGGGGGGGGGAIELTAAGTVTIGDLTATGGTGGNGANGGGGGSGGAILVRGKIVTAGAIASAGGSGGSGATAGGTGAVGRIRIDGSGTLPTTMPAAYRGPWIDPAQLRIVREPAPTFTVYSAPGKPFSYVIQNVDGTMTHSGNLIGGISGVTQIALPAEQALFPGRNRICLIVDGADAASTPEAQNCFGLAYIAPAT